MTLTAIETRYAGCRFRSRLEARWAVFFDHMKIRWQYEPEGFKVNWRLGDAPTGTPVDEYGWPNEPFAYLPDFFLPDLHLRVEVKGSLSDEECVRFLNATASLSSREGGCGFSPDMLVLGPVPEPHREAQRLPFILHLHKGTLVAKAFPVNLSVCRRLEEAPIDPIADSTYNQRTLGKDELQEQLRAARATHSEWHQRIGRFKYQGAWYVHHCLSSSIVYCHCDPEVAIADDYGENIFSGWGVGNATEAARLLLEGSEPIYKTSELLHAALVAARSARFEHGENGTP